MFVSTLSWASPSDLRAAGDSSRLRRPAPRLALPQRVDDERRAANDSRNPLAAAMLRAMQTLTGGSTAAPISDAPTDTVAAGATDLKDAAVAFAHELFGALRSEVGTGEGRQGHGQHHGHGRGQGYGKLAQRLEQLAQRLDTAPLPIPVPVPVPVPVPAPAPDPVNTLPPTTGPVPLPARAEEDTPAALAAGPLDALKSAFEQFFKALQPAASAPSSGADLAGFLRSVADALRGSSEPTPGGLLNLVA